jgi:thioredoxin reductase (NADPH)
MAQEQADAQGAEFRLAEAQGLAADGGEWVVATSQGDIRTKAVIVATGSHPKALGVPGEMEFISKGVSHCATCDGPFYSGQVVGVVGGGDSALQEALTLAGYASKVHIFHRGAGFSGQQVLQQRVQQNEKIETHLSTVVEEIAGGDEVTGLRVRDLPSGQVSEVELAGVFIYVGLVPSTGFLRGTLPLDAEGRITTDVWMRTGLAGVFAAGDLRTDSARQAISSAGDGATAAVAAHRYLIEVG